MGFVSNVHDDHCRMKAEEKRKKEELKELKVEEKKKKDEKQV